MHRKTICLFTFLLGLVVVGCTNQKGPEHVVREFYGLVKQGEREGFDSVQEKLYGLLDPRSQQVIAQRAEELKKAGFIPDTGKPFEYLTLKEVLAKPNPEKIEKVAEGAGRIRFKVKCDDSVAFLELVRVGGEWKIDLVTSTELNESGR